MMLDLTCFFPVGFLIPKNVIQTRSFLLLFHFGFLFFGGSCPHLHFKLVICQYSCLCLTLLFKSKEMSHKDPITHVVLPWRGNAHEEKPKKKKNLSRDMESEMLFEVREAFH